MLAEAALGLAAGVAAGSVALSGWAAGSAIEGAASLIVVWRFTGSRIQSPDAERRAQRAVAVSFWLLAAWIAAGAFRSLADHREVAASALGIALTASSVVIMPVLGITKRKLGQRLGSGATAGEGTQNLMCAAQAAAVLAGLAVVAIWPAWSATDQIIALGIAAWSVWEGRQSWRGTGCC
jgi:divalent metal cation (Fe/Co/Zn/Cd) transporter